MQLSGGYPFRYTNAILVRFNLIFRSYLKRIDIVWSLPTASPGSPLLKLFNVKLGWWFGNPGAAEEKRHFWQTTAPWRLEARPCAFHPFLTELIGFISSHSPYVYLTDDGHFDDLGLYEMVRRRCRL